MRSNNTLNHSAYRLTLLTMMAFILGSCVSLAAIAFVESVSWLNDVLLISPRTRVQVQSPILLSLTTLLVPMLGGLLIGFLLQKFSVEKRPLGPPDVIIATQLQRPLPSTKSGLLSTLAAMLSLGCGASVGQYGPMVYLGALFGHLTAHIKTLNAIPNLPSITLACGVAAAISTAFNAPIAGLVFAHEVILRHYSLQAFAPTTVASATGYVVANVIFERPALFLVDFAGVTHGYEFAIFALLGALCALLAVSFMKLTLAFGGLAQRSTIPALYRPALAGLVVGVVALGLPDVLGVGQETLRFATIEGAFEHWELILLVLAKMLLTALCIGFGFAGGVFSPSLLIGILSGALFWSLLTALGIENSGLVVYAVCGMMALTSPVIGAPLTTILIVFELTRNYDLTIAAMVGVVFANLITYRIFGRSLFDVQLYKKGIDLSSGRDQAMLQHSYVIDQPCSDTIHCQLNDSLVQTLQALSQSGRSESAVIDDQGIYQGILRIQDVINLTSTQQQQTLVHSVMTNNHPIFNEQTTLWQAMLTLDGFVGDAVPIVSSNNNKLLGMVTESSIIAAYLRVVHDLRREENEAV